jgi:GGDEF domain-containing protein
VKHLAIKHENEITISISQGVAVFPDDGSTGETILNSADTALYRAKRDGYGGLICISTPANKANIGR